MPNMLVLRPADAVEAAECWEIALEPPDRPVLADLRAPAAGPPCARPRRGQPLARAAPMCWRRRKAAHAARPSSRPGPRSPWRVEARAMLQAEGVPTAVVSMPSWELFERQDEAYRSQVIGRGTVRVAVEAAVRLGWDRYVGEDGGFVGMSGFGASGPRGRAVRSISASRRKRSPRRSAGVSEAVAACGRAALPACRHYSCRTDPSPCRRSFSSIAPRSRPEVKLRRPAFPTRSPSTSRPLPTKCWSGSRAPRSPSSTRCSFRRGAGKAAGLQDVAVAATGTDCVDKAWCQAHGIAVTNIRGYALRTVPEHTFALMLALRRSIIPYREDTLAGEWQKSGQFCFFDHPIRDLRRGAPRHHRRGRAGPAGGRARRAFGMVTMFAAHKGKSGLGPLYTPWEKVLETSDIITLHCPLTPRDART